MKLIDISVKRPVLTSVFMLLITLSGILGLTRLPLRQLPDIDQPVVSVGVSYPGASAEVMESRVTQVLESAVSGIEGIKQITSTSRDERANINIEFNLSRDIDAAASDVRDAVSRSTARLPDEVTAPVVSKANADSFPVLWMTLTSSTLSPLELTDYADRNLVDRFSLLPGVAAVRISGERRLAMRIWLDLAAMATKNVTVQDIERAIDAQNIELPAGRLESSAREFTLRADATLKTAADFSGIIVRQESDVVVRLSDVARIERGPAEERTALRWNGKPAIGLGILPQSKANVVAIADGVKREMEAVRQILPPEIEINVNSDTSIFIKAALVNLLKVVGEAFLIVVLVIYFFLRSWRATLIPSFAIPVSIIGAFAIVALLGYSLNTLTLLAAVLAVGLVVDDAIVVVENIQRRIEAGEPPLLATLRGGKQIAFAVIATTLVLVAVFLPVALQQGNIGRLFTEFGVTLAVAVAVSALVALTLAPMLSAQWLRKETHPPAAWAEKLNNSYAWLLARVIDQRLLMGLAVVGALGLSYVMLQSLPRELTPVEDRGEIAVTVNGPDGATLSETMNSLKHVEEIVLPMRTPEGGVNRMLALVVGQGGQSGAVNTGRAIIRLNDWSERDVPQSVIQKKIQQELDKVPGLRASASSPGGLGRGGFSAPFQLVIGGSDYAELRLWRDRALEALGADKRFINLRADYNETKPQLDVNIDRARAADQGLEVATLGQTLETVLGERQVSTFTERGEQYDVILKGDPAELGTRADLNKVFVRTQGGSLQPLTSFLSLDEIGVASELGRVDRIRSVTLSATLAPDFALGNAVAFAKSKLAEILPAEARISFLGDAREYTEGGNAILFVFLLALLVVFLVLAAQFESWQLPFIVMTTVPLALLGALLTLWISGTSVNLYSQLAMIMLVGLVAKNGILIVEFANQLRAAGLAVREATLEAAQTRLRPVMMTSVATVLGAVPLVLGTGAGSESRASIGWVIIGGVTLSTILTLVVVPCLYAALARRLPMSTARTRELAELERQYPDSMDSQPH
jgi:multidrug efflux pump